MSDTNPQQIPAIALIALHAGFSHSSLALRSIAAYAARESDLPPIHLFESLVNKNQQDLLEKIVELQPAVIGFSTYLWNIEISLHLAELLRQLLPASRIVMGGPEAGPRGEELLSRFPELDFVIDGEGEAAFRDLLYWILRGKGRAEDISGLVWRVNDGIKRNPVRSLTVESIPSLLSHAGVNFDKPLVYWETSRGCPFKCSFCTSAGDRLRAFPLARIEADLAVIEGLQNKVIKLLDRSFHLGRERTVKLLERFAATPDGLRFHLELNPDRISGEAMEIFRQAAPGKFQFEIGLQTLNESVLYNIDRRMQIPLALDNIRELVKMARHPVHLDLIVGLPGEAAEHCRDSLNQTFRLHADHLQLGTLKLLPGTPLRERADRFGYRWDRRPPYEVLSHSKLGFREMARFKLYAELLERFWNSGYLRTTLIRLVSMHFDDRLCDCFEALLDRLGEGIARDNLQPDSLFGLICDFLESIRIDDPVLQELLLWDYSHFSLVNGKTADWIAQRLRTSVSLAVAGSRRRLPVLSLSEDALAVVNRRLLQPLSSGDYAVWPKQHKKGKPVQIIRIPPPES